MSIRVTLRYDADVPRRPALLLLLTTALAILVAVPALAAGPAASGAPGKADKASGEKTGVSLSGTIAAATDADGETSYTLQSGGTTYTLDAGPAWYFGDKHPLKPFVGKSVTVTGEKAADSTTVDVTAVNGTALRAEGKPPWAGGWKRVGQAHPGWSQAKADRAKAKAAGDCFPPGQCKHKAANPAPSTNPTH